MNFPKWTNLRSMSQQEKASARLRYLINCLAAQYSAAASIQSIARAVGVSHSAIINYINAGKFSDTMALRFEDTFGRDVLPNEWLRAPLAIK